MGLSIVGDTDLKRKLAEKKVEQQWTWYRIKVVRRGGGIREGL